MDHCKMLSGIAAACAATTCHLAGAVPISITDASFVAGAGYGVDQDEGQGTRLGMQFSTNPTLVAQTFELDAIGQSYQFNFGQVTLNEP